MVVLQESGRTGNVVFCHRAVVVHGLDCVIKQLDDHTDKRCRPHDGSGHFVGRV
jgi:hypothetical protein